VDMTNPERDKAEHQELVQLAVELRELLFDDANGMMKGAMVGSPVECVAFAKWWIQRQKGFSMLGGSADSVDAFNGAVGKTIAGLTLSTDNALHFVFDDGSKMRLFDDRQSCCESRYMRTDDNLAEFVGAKLLGAEIKEAPPMKVDDDYGEHEVEFLELKTDRGVFTMANHNEHNGSYGGFLISAAVE